MKIKRRHFQYLIFGAIATGCALALAVTSSPSHRCARVQQRILLESAYSNVPDRAWDSAQIMCERNSNTPDRFPYNKFEKF